MKSSPLSFIPLSVMVLTILMVSGCTTTPSPNSAQSLGSISQTQQRLEQLFAQLSIASKRKQTLEQISDCRYQISSHWSSRSQGYYRAKSSQRFSFTHDLRAVDHTPSYTLEFDTGTQQWQETMELTFNRPLPLSFSYYDNQTFEANSRESTADQFSLLGFSLVPLTLMKDIQATMTHMAKLCGNDISRNQSIEHKIIGRWDLYDLEKSIGLLTVGTNEAILQQDQQPIIRGPYTITAQTDHHTMIINPDDHNNRFELRLNFVNSLYARVILAGNDSSPVAFSPLYNPQGQDKNPNEIKLFRLGDLQ